MIIDRVLDIIFTILNFFLSLIPTGASFPSEFTSSLTTLVSTAQEWDKLVPVHTLFIILGLVFAIEAGMFVFKFVNWVWTRIRGGGGGRV